MNYFPVCTINKIDIRTKCFTAMGVDWDLKLVLAHGNMCS